MTVNYSARSHIGKVRGNNEDNLYVDGVILPANLSQRRFTLDGSTVCPAVFVVCDGLGGEEYGELASRLAVEKLQEHRERLLSVAPRELPGKVRAYVEDADRAIRQHSGDRRIGTTLALAVAAKSGVYCFNMGDSRIYCLRSGALRQVTHDHTLLAELRRSDPEAVNAPQGAGSKLTCCLGIGAQQSAEGYPPLRGSCRVLICSDGLSGMVSGKTLEQILLSYTSTSEAADALLCAALKNGGRDNVTLIILDIKRRRLPLFHS